MSKQTGINKNWVEESSTLARKSNAKSLKKAKKQEIGKQYTRIPHPTLKNTFILKEK